VCEPSRYFDHEMFKDIVIVYMLLHNMIVEDEWHLYLRAYDFNYEQIDESPHDHTQELMDFIDVIIALKIERLILNLNQTTMSIYDKYIVIRKNL
jgi:hypothetical protein